MLLCVLCTHDWPCAAMWSSACAVACALARCCSSRRAGLSIKMLQSVRACEFALLDCLPPHIHCNCWCMLPACKLAALPMELCVPAALASRVHAVSIVKQHGLCLLSSCAFSSIKSSKEQRKHCPWSLSAHANPTLHFLTLASAVAVLRGRCLHQCPMRRHVVCANHVSWVVDANDAQIACTSLVLSAAVSSATI